MKQNNPSEEQMRRADRDIENHVIRMAFGMDSHVVHERLEDADGNVVKLVTKTTPRKPYVEACNRVIDMYNVKTKKGKPNKTKIKQLNKRIDDALSHVLSGMNKRIDETKTISPEGEVIKIVTKTTSTKPNLEACKDLLDRYESEKKKLKRRVKK